MGNNFPIPEAYLLEAQVIDVDCFDVVVDFFASRKALTGDVLDTSPILAGNEIIFRSFGANIAANLPSEEPLESTRIDSTARALRFGIELGLYIAPMVVDLRLGDYLNEISASESIEEKLRSDTNVFLVRNPKLEVILRNFMDDIDTSPSKQWWQEVEIAAGIGLILVQRALLDEHGQVAFNAEAASLDAEISYLLGEA